MSINKELIKGFTIIEMLVVIVVVSILMGLIVIEYSGVRTRAIDVSVKSDVEQMEALQTNYSIKTGAVGKAYSSEDGFDDDLRFTPSGNNVISVIINSIDYCIRGYNTDGSNNSIDNPYIRESAVGACQQILAASNCPTGFIPVPGSSTYNTNNFCVMKYEAKDVGGVATSQAALAPWTSITKANAANAATAACTGCHLITEAEWLTIAQNALGVSSNWSGGAVGSGYIYSGHSDIDPSSAQQADSNDANGYAYTNDFSGDMTMTNGKIGDTQRRTLNLSNGEVIWDLSGNVWEWTNDTIAGGQQPGLSSDITYAWKQWNDASFIVNGLPATSMPGSTGISGASNWSTAQGIGALYSYYGESNLRVLVRGGVWTNCNNAGVLALNLQRDPNGLGGDVGFRAAR